MSATTIRNGCGCVVAARSFGSAVGNPKEKIRIEPVESPVPEKTPAPVEPPVETPEPVKVPA